MLLGGDTPSPTPPPALYDDVDKDLMNVLKYISSTLSVIGAGSILVSRFRDKAAWQRPARQLLLWLSVADLGTALVYMVPAQADDGWCKAQALVGMYFPIASFLLTDCIAYFVYLIVCDQYRRRWKLLRSPEQLFFLFHCVSWGLPVVFCAIVLGFDHAGKGTSYNIDWCWIKGKDDRDEFYWQLVGGKAVEWFSFIVWCPPLYYLCWDHLSKQEAYSRATSRLSYSTADETTTGTESPLSLSETTNPSMTGESVVPSVNGGSGLHAHSVNGSSTLHAPLLSEPHYHEHDEPNSGGREPLLASSSPQPAPLPPLPSSSAASPAHTLTHSNGDPYDQPPMHVQTNGQHLHTHEVTHQAGVYIHETPHSRVHSRTQSDRDRMLTTSTTSTLMSQEDHASHPITFTQFKWKLILVPVIFFFLRFWGSLRALLAFINSEFATIPSGLMDFLEVMQTVCDPAQGTFNGLLFAACTKPRRSASEGDERWTPAGRRGLSEPPKESEYDSQIRRGANGYVNGPATYPSSYRFGADDDHKPRVDFDGTGGENGLARSYDGGMQAQVSLKPVAGAASSMGPVDRDRDSRAGSGVRWSDNHGSVLPTKL